MKQNIIVTALPNGLSGKTDKPNKLSVVLSLQITDTANTTLANVKDMLRWAAIMKQATFTVMINDIIYPSQPRVTSEIDTALWENLFTDSVKVAPFEPEAAKLLQMQVRSYPVKHIVNYVIDVMKVVGTKFSDTMPDAAYFTENEGSEKFTDISMYKVPRVFPSSQKRQFTNSSEFLLSRLVMENNIGIDGVKDRLESSLRHVPFGDPSPIKNFAQLRMFHGLYNKKVKTYTEPSKPDFEFHDILSILTSYPQIMRRLGLVIDLEIGTLLPASGNIRIIPSGLVLQETTNIICHPTNYISTSQGFYTGASPYATSMIDKGYLKINVEKNFTVYQMDADGAALKLGQMMDGLQLKKAKTYHAAFLNNIRLNDTLPWFNNQLPGGANDLPQKEGLPALRTAGIGIARNGMANNLVKRFNATDDLVRNPENINKPLPSSISSPHATYQLRTAILYADDVNMGYRMDILENCNGIEAWRSLHQQHNSYAYVKQNTVNPIAELTDEGFIQISAAQDTDESGEFLKVGETLARWEGWSLSVPKPGRALKDNMIDNPEDNNREEWIEKTNEAKSQIPGTTGFQLKVTPGIVPGTLPKLRFGNYYKIKVRTVDLAGNSVPHTTLPENEKETVVATTYKRYDPVSTPVLVMGNKIKDGESIEQMVIRSSDDFNWADYENKKVTGLTADAVRHVKPPRCTVQMAEQHGLLDAAFGNGKENAAERLYEKIVSKDPLYEPTDATSTMKVFLGDSITVNYLADPMAVGATFFLCEADPNPTSPASPSIMEQVYFYADKVSGPFTVLTPLSYDEWFQPKPFKIKLMGGTAPATNWIEATRTLEIQLQPGFMYKLSYSCFSAPGQILTSGLRELLGENISDELYTKIKTGRHWMFSPWRDITFVHAVQQPVQAPLIMGIKPLRELGSTMANISVKLTVHSQSTDRIDIESKWLDWVDDINKPAVEKMASNSNVYHFSATYSEDQYQLGNVDGNIKNDPATAIQQQFGDTKHRLVDYKIIAATRYREYFTALLKKNPSLLIKKESTEFKQVNILSSAPPLAPEVAYVIPTFEWENLVINKAPSRTRLTALRVYLKRPWYSSGEGEQLAVILFPEGKLVETSSIYGNMGIPETMLNYFTTWGTDPIRKSPTIKSITPGLTDFRKPALVEKRLSMVEQNVYKADAAIYDVKYDYERQLYYADIMVSNQDTLPHMPFIRLALARYQKESVRTSEKDCCLSPVVLADYIQIAANYGSMLSVSDDRKSIRLSVGGPVASLGIGSLTTRVDTFVDEIDVPVANSTHISVINSDKEVHVASDSQIIQAGELKSGNLFSYIKYFSNLSLSSPSKAYRVKVMIYEVPMIDRQRPQTDYLITENGVPRGRLIFADAYEVGIGSPITAYTTGNGTTQHIIYRDTAGHLQEWYGSNDWKQNDLTVAANNAPAAMSNPFAFGVIPGDTQHVIYLGAGNHIYELWAGGVWAQRDITVQTNAPLPAGNFAAFTTGKTKHITYRDAIGHIHELWAGDFNWNWGSVTGKANVPAAALAAGDPSAYTTNNQTIQHIIYRDWDGHICELLEWKIWTYNNLTQQAGLSGSELAAGDPVGYTTEDGAVERIVYTGQDGHIHELFSQKVMAGVAWYHGNLTVLAGVPGYGLPLGKLAAYTSDNTKTPHIIYRGKDNQVYELWLGNNKWNYKMLTFAAMAPRAAGDPVCYVSMEGTVSIQNVVYLAEDGDLIRLSKSEHWKKQVISGVLNSILHQTK